MRQRLLYAIILLALAGIPGGALGHGGHEEHDGGVVEPQPTQDPDTRAPADGYTGPGRAPYISFFNGAWLYGSASATPLGDQMPRNIRGAGDWLVWEDATRSEIYAYNIPAGSGFYITNDRAVQRNPDISGNVVVWEDYRDGRSAAVYAYFLDTAETRRISAGDGNHRSPSVYGTLVAWEDDRNGTRDIWGARLDGTPPFPIHVGADRESDPLVLDEVVYYRTYRFNVWDIYAKDIRNNVTIEITSDTQINQRPFTNGRDVFFLSQLQSAWVLERYDVRRDRTFETALRFVDTARKTIEGDRLLDAVRDLSGHFQLVARNLTSGTNTHVSGNLVLTTEPHLQDGVAYVTARTRNGTSLLALKISEFAWGKQPALTITSPSSVAPWLRPVTVQGILSTGPGWTEPATFSVSVDGGAPQIIVPGERWRATLDPKGFEPGVHSVVVRATFREGPPVQAGINLVIPFPYDSVDVAKAGPAYHAGRVMGMFNEYVGHNPAAFFLIPLLLVILALVAFRVYIKLRARKAQSIAEYVPPE